MKKASAVKEKKAPPSPADEDAGAAAGASEPTRQNAPVRKKRGVGRFFRLLAISLVGAAVVVGAATWMQEDSLRDAEQALDQNDPERALALVSYFLETNPSHDQALAVKARALADLGDAEEALKLYDRIGAATPAEMHSWARAFMATGQWSKAIPLLIQVTRREPQNADAMYELTSCHIRMTNLDEAVATAKKLVKIPGQEINGNITLSAIYFDLEDYTESVRCFAKAAELSPDGSKFPLPANEAFFQYGSALLALGRGEEAAVILEKSIANRPSAPAYLVMGNALNQAGRSEEARRAWEMSLKLDPKNGRAREALANAALQRGEPEVGLEYLQPLVGARQLRQSTAYLLNRIYTRLNRPEEAETFRLIAEKLRAADERSGAIDQLLVRTPNSFWANVIRAHRFASDGNWTMAKEISDKLVKEAPQDAYVAELHAAIEKRGQLPSLDKVPLKGF